MRKLKYILASIAVVMFAASCDLDQVVYSDLTDSNFPRKESDYQSLVDGMYGYLKGNSGGVRMERKQFIQNVGWKTPMWSLGELGWLGWNLVTTDQMTNSNYANKNHRFQTNITTSKWERVYQYSKDVSRMTYIIGKIEESDMTDAAKKRLIAESKALRGTYMFMLYDMFGPVQVVLDPAEIENVKYEKRPSKDDYVSWMVKDFEDALPDLKGKTNHTSDWGRVNQGYCAMYLARIYMKEKQWQKAIDVLEPVLDLGYQVSADYFEPFSNEECDENIWCVPGGETAANEFFLYAIPGNAKVLYGLNPAHASEGEGGHIVNKAWGSWCMPWAYYDTFSENDVRRQGLAASFLATDGKVYDRSNPGPGTSRLNTGVVVCKYFTTYDKMVAGDIHIVVFRLPEVYLSLAECYTRLSSAPTAKAVEYLKKTTDRAGITSEIPADVFTNKDKFLDFILEERGHEFYWEGQRRDDLIRYDKLISSALERGYSDATDRCLYMPIPQDVITASGGLVEQNPGY
ncbi:MAG: RagB/SusD family nutrient uptake outer membrane protein [Candidatus Cryptobacteroides sp.]